MKGIHYFTIQCYNDVYSHLLVGVMFYLCYLYIFMYTSVKHDFHIRRSSCRLPVTRRVSLIEQELPTLPEHMSSHPVLCGVLVAQSLVFCVVFCGSLFVLVALVIVLYVLRFVTSEYLFGIFKLFFL